MKKFKLEFIEDDNGNLTITGYNDGFYGTELIGLLEMKKQDLVDQMNGKAEYERTCRTDDGGLIDISKKERK